MNFYRYLKKVGHKNIKKMINKREMRITWTLFFVCFCYFLFVGPISFINMIDNEGNYPQLHLGFFCVYWLQYSLNCLIYVTKSEQYRGASLYFLQKVINSASN